MKLVDRAKQKEQEFVNNGDWKGLITYWDARDERRERTYYEHKDSIDITIADAIELEETEAFDLKKIYEISDKEDFIDIIAKSRYEYIQDLIEDSDVYAVINLLTDKQKKILFLYGVEKYKTSEIAEMLGISARGVRKHLEAIKSKVFKALGIELDLTA